MEELSSSEPTIITKNNPRPITMDDIIWPISFCKAFPTNFIQILSIMKEDEEDEEKHTYIIPAYLSIIAFYSLFPKSLLNCKEETTIISVSKPSCDTTSEEKSNVVVGVGDSHTIHSSSLTYGEILPESIIEILHWIKTKATTNANTNTNNNTCRIHNNILLSKTSNNIGGKVMDIGSGSGKVLLSICTNHIFDKVYGIEISSYWHNKALQNLSTWKRDSTNLPYQQQQTEFTFINGDIRDNEILLQDIDLIILHGTLFDKELMGSIEDMIERCCKIGTIVISISREIRLGSCDDNNNVLSTQRQRMNWGETNVFIQEKCA